MVKRVSESNLRNVRNLDGFARSILRRIEDEGIDVGRADLSALDRDVADAIRRHVDDRIVHNSDFSTVQVVNALKEMSRGMQSRYLADHCYIWLLTCSC